MTAVRNFIITFLLSLLVFGLIAYGLIQFAVSAFELDGGPGGVPAETTGGEEQGGPDGPIVDPPPGFDGIAGESFTALLVGTNYQPTVFEDYDVTEENETIEGFPLEPRKILAESIVLLRVNKETGECIFSAIPSTTKMVAGGHSVLLREYYADYGIDALCEKVMAMTGLPIDYYAVIHIDEMIALIDDYGGITYYVNTDMHYVDETIGFTVNLRRGSQKLDGKTALAMLRYPDYPDGDDSRRQCAVDFLKELAKKIITDSDKSNAAVIFRKYKEKIETNFELEDLVANVDLLFAYNKMTIRTYTYPGTTVGTGEGAYFTPQISQAITFFKSYKYKG